jgi:hypothetical protein
LYIKPGEKARRFLEVRRLSTLLADFDVALAEGLNHPKANWAREYLERLYDEAENIPV